MTHDPSTLRHESAHVAACLICGAGRRVTSVRVDHPEVNVLGKMTSDLDREVGPEDVVINLAGWMADGTYRGEWPPSWPVPVDAAEGIGLLIRHLKLTERQYHGTAWSGWLRICSQTPPTSVWPA